MKDSNEKRRPVILCFIAHYLPGHRSGGPVRSVANFIDHLGDEFDIRVVCADRDALDSQPYANVSVDSWNGVGKARVFYASKKTITFRGIRRLLANTPHDLLYLNSFFASGFSLLPLLVRRLGLAPKVPCVIAPRGEFSQGAIELKAKRKRIYIWLSKQLGVYRQLYWQASTELELQDIQRELGDVPKKTIIAANVPALTRLDPSEVSERQPGPFRLVFLSRISPKKNLDFLLKALGKVKADAELTIYGPVDEADYWLYCQSLINSLPKNIKVAYRGDVMPDSVSAAFSAADLFAFPTRGENYGHVIFEALMAGTPVLLSDRTPWQSSGDSAVQVLSIEDSFPWAKAIELWAKLDYDRLNSRRRAAQSYARWHADKSEAVERNRALFLQAAKSG